MKLSRDAWLKLKPLLSTALEMDAVARNAWLVELRTSHPGEAPVLAMLLRSHERAERSGEMETVPRLASAPPSSSDFREGEHVGPFRLLRPIGRGGMGEVWLAEQDDGRVSRQVALKLPTALEAREIRAERFQRERDILAKLAHPNIARLYDAGVSDAGQPYLAMEFVQGVPLDEYVESRSLPIAARLGLLRQVLAAVAHAHHHLVVHRDLKPANILIDEAGQVKLLDFGIAKLVQDDAASTAGTGRDLTRLGGRIMTLRYAAPEQIAEGEITTATDIYSLGVVLHELVTGASPYRAVREGRPLAQVMLLQEEIAVPSMSALSDEAARSRALASPKQLARSVAGDLDAIILKAMRRDPAARYASVEPFDDDIRRHLERRPVKARAGTWRYLAGRFTLRHKLPLALAAAVVVTMAVGLLLVERQRRVAVAEKARAEQYFASVRSLANAFIFDVHDEIENLAGSLKARQRLVSTSLKYLDSLASEGADDPGLALEVAIAYRKVAEIQGDVYASNTGEMASARRNLEKAVSLLAALDARTPGDIRILREQQAVTRILARVLKDGGDGDGAIRLGQSAIRIAEQVVALPGAAREDRRRLALACADHGVDLAVLKSDPAAATVMISRALEYLEPLVRENPDDLLARGNLAGSYERASIVAEMGGRKEDLPRAIELMAKSAEMTEALARDEPLNQAHTQALVKRYSNLASTQGEYGDVKAAAISIARAVEIVGRLYASEPGNAGIAMSRIRAFVVGSEIELAAGSPMKAIALARSAIAAYDKLPEASRSGMSVRANIAVARGTLGQSAAVQARDANLPTDRRLELLREARSQLTQSMAFRQDLIERNIDAASATRIVAQHGEAIHTINVEIERLSGEED